MVIPFRTLRYVPGADRVWGLQIMRNLRRRNEQSFWTPVSRAFDLLQVDVAGEMEGLDLEFQRSLQLIPYVLGGLDQDYTRNKRPTRFSRDAGLDLKYSLTPSLTLDATFNTDFAKWKSTNSKSTSRASTCSFPKSGPSFWKTPASSISARLVKRKSSSHGELESTNPASKFRSMPAHV
jgi:hypothetical protein